MNWFLKLFPPKLQPAAPGRPVEINDEEVKEFLSRVSDMDPCLRAHYEIIGRHLVQAAEWAGHVDLADNIKLRACERMECFRMLLHELEERREAARQWRLDKEKAEASRH